MQDNNSSVSKIEDSSTRSKISQKHTDLRARFAVYYYLTGDLEQAVELAGYSVRQDNVNLIQWYKWLDLPEPMVTTTGSDLVDSIALKLSTDDLAGIIAQAAKDGKDNRIATQLIDLYQERERQQAQLKFSKLDVERCCQL